MIFISYMSSDIPCYLLNNISSDRINVHVENCTNLGGLQGFFVEQRQLLSNGFWAQFLQILSNVSGARSESLCYQFDINYQTA